jgi:hypothetical protein
MEAYTQRKEEPCFNPSDRGNKNAFRERPIAGSSLRAATDSRNRAEYLKMEERWLRLADGYQFSERLNLFVADKERARKMD